MSKKSTAQRKISLLFDDQYYAAFLKPAGLLTVPTDKGGETQTLVQLVNEQYGKEGPDGFKMHPCHRLDKETSGLILFAKGHKAELKMDELFREREVEKVYIAFAHGRLARDKGKIQIALKGDKRKGGEISTTNYRLVKQRTHYAIVEVRPLTGRTNQIRIHFKEIGHPLVGENKFAFRRDFQLRFKRTALHAASLKFLHPYTEQKVFIEAPLPTDMMNFLERNPT